MSVEAANGLVSGGYGIQPVTIETQPETMVRLDVRSDHGSAAVVLQGVVELEVRQRFSNWPFSLQLCDISDRQLEGLAVAVSDGQEDQFRRQRASLEVHIG